jgi:Fic family protein
MYVRKEALLSSQIEGTQSSFSDLMLFEHKQKPKVSLEDVEEVSNYVKAINYGMARLRDDFPLSLRLLKEIHSILLTGVRGSTKLPGEFILKENRNTDLFLSGEGAQRINEYVSTRIHDKNKDSILIREEFRRSQNWIGGTRPGNASFVPPPVEYLADCLSDFEKFLHDENTPVLIKAALAHVQFETIHPFLDGNGRLGRLLITLILCADGMLDEPILYLSLYLKKNRHTYYQLLQEVRESGNWEVWLEFFLIGIYQSATQAINTAENINNLFIKDLAKISLLERARFSCEKIFEYMKTLPQVSVPFLSKALNLTPPTVRDALNNLQSIGILEEISGKKRDKVYVYRKYLDILENG